MRGRGYCSKCKLLWTKNGFATLWGRCVWCPGGELCLFGGSSGGRFATGGYGSCGL